jgi:hypothetical protein
LLVSIVIAAFPVGLVAAGAACPGSRCQKKNYPYKTIAHLSAASRSAGGQRSLLARTNAAGLTERPLQLQHLNT